MTTATSTAEMRRVVPNHQIKALTSKPTELEEGVNLRLSSEDFLPVHLPSSQIRDTLVELSSRAAPEEQRVSKCFELVGYASQKCSSTPKMISWRIGYYCVHVNHTRTLLHSGESRPLSTNGIARQQAQADFAIVSLHHLMCSAVWRAVCNRSEAQPFPFVYVMK